MIILIFVKNLSITSFFILPFSGRGAIHGHCLLYMKNSPSIQTSDQAFEVMHHFLRKDAKDHLIHLKAQECGIDDMPEMSAEDKVIRAERLKSNYDKYTAIQKARRELENFVVENLGISCMHPNMNPQNWKAPFGEVSLKFI